MTCHELTGRIDAYVDRELAAEERSLVEGHLAGCAGCRRQLEQREALGQLLRRLPYYQAPPQMPSTVTRVHATLSARHRVRGWMAAAATVVLGAGAVEGLLVLRMARATSTVAEAVVARHVDAMASPRLIDVPSSDQHTVKPWFQGKLDFSPPVPDLAPAGFPLAGGRVDRVGGRPAAALVYRRRLHVINVFIWSAGDTTRVSDARTIRGFHERHWTSGGLSVWAVSDVSEDDLKTFAEMFEAGSR
jgi:anti-sigma factor RsiW